MTTPKPKARKAACVWVVECDWRGGWHATFGALHDSAESARAEAKQWRNSHHGKFRIRKYQRIDK